MTDPLAGADFIDGGLVDGSHPEGVTAVILNNPRLKGPFDIDRHRARVTVVLIALLAGLIAGNYICLMVLEWNGKSAQALSNAFNASLPIVSGLAGSAITYYFTKTSTSPK